MMNSVILLTKLIEIEQAIGVEDPIKIRRMVIEAEECLLGIQKESLDRHRAGNPAKPIDQWA